MEARVEPELVSDINNSSLNEDECCSYDVVVYRAAELPARYQGLVYSAWVNSFWTSNRDFRKKFDKNRLQKELRMHIEKVIFTRPDCLIRLAILSDKTDTVLGFSVSREDVLDYVYVKGPERRHGIGSSLLPKPLNAYTHSTYYSRKILKDEKYKHIRFKPHV